MNRKQHNMKSIQFGIDIVVADSVNKDKDAPSQKYPGCIHHSFNHGIGTNIKYFQVGKGGMITSVIHNIDDRLTRRCKRPIIIERARNWSPGKLINNAIQIGDWWKER